MLDAVLLGNLLGELILSSVAGEVLAGTPSLLGHLEGMLFKPLRLLEKKRLQLHAVHALRPQELSHGPTALERQVATEEDSVKAGERSDNLVSVLLEECWHPSIRHGPSPPPAQGLSRQVWLRPSGRARRQKGPTKKPTPAGQSSGGLDLHFATEILKP